jgi:hypothetical protein
LVTQYQVLEETLRMTFMTPSLKRRKSLVLEPH